MNPSPRTKQGFTLIELSIVLVIIGLIIGGVLVGQDLVSAAATRATIAQIEKYNSAVNTFDVKYGYIPGDIPDPYASQFGFAARGSLRGQGDGNGLLEGQNSGGGCPNVGMTVATGENAVFWQDLGTARLIEGTYSGSPTTLAGTISSDFPLAKTGNGSYIITFSNVGANYFGIESITTEDSCYVYSNSFGLTVAQAYSIDKKIDDGLPSSGRVQALYNHAGGLYWDLPASSWGGGQAGLSYISATASATTCFDDGGSLSNPWKYSMSYNGGSGANCPLTIQMQGAAGGASR